MIPLPDVLRTDRLCIRPFLDRDLGGFLAFMTDPEATRYLLFDDAQRTPDGARALFDAVRASYGTDEPILAYAVAEKDSDAFVGSCGLSPLDAPGQWECYYSLLPTHWGRGYASEATAALLDYARVQPGVEAVWAFMSPENPHSAGVARRVGMEDRGMRTHPVFGNEGHAFVRTT